MDKMTIYNSSREVPREAQKAIGGGRLKGMTDINPMWRIKILTEMFGPCGTGWKYDILKKEVIEGANEEKAAFVDINLFYKENGEWSEPVPGTGGSMFVSKEKGGLYVNDECFKMALTDAISVAGKALGIGANIYFAKDRTKYTQPEHENNPEPKSGKKMPETKVTATHAKALMDLIEVTETDPADVLVYCNVPTINEMTMAQYVQMTKHLEKKRDNKAS